MSASASAGVRAAAAARLGEAAALPACPSARARRPRRGGEAPRLEHEAAAVDDGGQAQLAGAVLAALLRAPAHRVFAMMPRQRAPDLAEAEQHDVAAARRGSPRRRRSWRAGTPRGPRAAPSAASWAATTNEMFSSDEPWAMATMLMPACRQRREHARRDAAGPAMPRPTTATVARPSLHLDAVDLLARDLVAELLEQTRARPLAGVARAR